MAIKRRHREQVKASKATTTENQFGLGLPNGEVLWNTWNGHTFTTADDREKMHQTLIMTAQQCGFDQEEFLQSYTWHQRTVTTTVEPLGVLPVDSPQAYRKDATTGGDTDDDHNDAELDPLGDVPGNG